MQDELHKHQERVRDKARRPTVTLYLGDDGIALLDQLVARRQIGRTLVQNRSSTIRAALKLLCQVMDEQAHLNTGGPFDAA